MLDVRDEELDLELICSDPCEEVNLPEEVDTLVSRTGWHPGSLCSDGVLELAERDDDLNSDSVWCYDDAGTALCREDSDMALCHREDSMSACSDGALHFAGEDTELDSAITFCHDVPGSTSSHGGEFRSPCGDEHGEDLELDSSSEELVSFEDGPYLSHDIVPVALDFCFSFTWAFRLWAILKRIFGEDRVLARLFSTPLIFSSHFSGLGTLEVALSMLSVAGQSAMRAKFQIHTAYACEKSLHCQRVLLRRMQGGCVFKNILDRFADIPMDFCKHGRLNFDLACAAVMSARVQSSGMCAVHQVPCTASAVYGDVSGSPCTPWARTVGGTRLGRQHPYTLLLVAWCALMRSTGVRIALHENVCGFDASLLVDLLGDLYHIHQLSVWPGQASFLFIRRPRLYFVLVLKSALRVVRSIEAIYATVCHEMRCRAEMPTAWVWRADPEELREEENSVRRRRNLPALREDEPVSPDWSYLLSMRQRASLDEQRRRWVAKHGVEPRLDPECCFNLAQTPEYTHASQSLPTFTRGSGRLWSPSRARWLLPRERAAAMGFPVYPDLARAALVELDTVTNLGPKYAVGNAMHVANLGCILATVLLATETP